MISLLYKELLVQKRVLGMAFLYIFVFSFAMKNLGEQLPLAIITAVSYMFVLYGGAWDEKASSDRLWNSLPVPKWKIVGAKYLSVLVYVAGVAVLTWAVFAVLSMVGMGGISTPVRLEHAAGAAISGRREQHLPARLLRPGLHEIEDVQFADDARNLFAPLAFVGSFG